VISRRRASEAEVAQAPMSEMLKDVAAIPPGENSTLLDGANAL